MTARKGKKSRQALGKGLGALIPQAAPVRGAAAGREFFMCPIERIRPQKGQPRQRFDEQTLSALVESIRERGVIQPPVVRRDGDAYELIAGERRWRAAQLAGVKEIPVVVKEANPAEAFELALVENIQREDLNPIEEALAFERLIEEHGHTQAEVATLVGRNRTTVTNSLRLLKLPAEVRELVVDGQLFEGHARALLQAGPPQSIIALARQAVSQALTVRETERRARALANGGAPTKKRAAAAESAEARAVSEKLQRALGAKVRLVDRKGKGRVEITYTSYDELDGILKKIIS